MEIMSSICHSERWKWRGWKQISSIFFNYLGSEVFKIRYFIYQQPTSLIYTLRFPRKLKTAHLHEGSQLVFLEIQ